MEKQYQKPKTQTARRSVTPRKRLSESEGDGVCVVCAHPVHIYAVGHCDHYICFKCSTKIRLLCEEILCPVCRKELPKVIFSKKRDSFQALNTLKLIKDNDYDVGVYFADIAIIKDYKRILEHRCPVCHDRPPDETFDETKVHLRKEHTLFYCEICLEHNRTFTSECKVYNRKDLATHKRIGDPDDKSHRGHPNCEYCDVRFLDDDKLFHHLRTNHYYCHLCDQGESNEFYGTYPDLRDHFKDEHFLCEEGGCINEEFTSVFGTELDFKAHIASVHKDHRSKQQQKKDRQIDLGFQYSRREPASSFRGRGASRGNDRSRPQQSRQNDFTNYNNAFERESDLNRAIALSKEDKQKPEKKTKNREVKKAEPKPVEPEAPKEKPAAITNQPTAFTRDDFPNLRTAVKKKSEGPKNSDAQMTKSASGNNLLLWSKDPQTVTSKFQANEDFPSLPSSQKPGPSSVPWAAATKSTKSSKKTKDTHDFSNRAPSAMNSVGAKTNQGKNKNNSKNFKPKEDDFPKLNALNEVLVGRGSSKHLEAHESFADGPASNVAVVSAEFKDLSEGRIKPDKKVSTFNASKDDFPSLSSRSKVSAPPGFSNVTPKPFLQGSASLQSTAKKPSSSSVGIRAPPGFSSNSNSKGTNSSKPASESKNNVFPASAVDFPSFVRPEKVASAAVDFNPTNHNHNHVTSTDERKKNAKSNNNSKKKSKGFRSNNRESDFPALSREAPMYDWKSSSNEPSEHVVAKPRKPPIPPMSKNLKLSNIFD